MEWLDDLDVEALLDELEIPYSTEGKNIGAGWIGIDTCPWCGATNNHLGVSLENKGIRCWVCGTTGTILKLIMKHEHISLEAAVSLIKNFRNLYSLSEDMDLEEEVENILAEENTDKKQQEKKKDKIQLPGVPITGKTVLQYPILAKFLRKRRITISTCKEWGFKYDHKSKRLIMPVRDTQGNLIAYQQRDVTLKAHLKYITHPKGAPLKNTMFGIEKSKPGIPIILVEGIIDKVITDYNLRRNGIKDTQALALFSNNPTHSQLALIEKLHPPTVYTMFDNDSWFHYQQVDIQQDIIPILLPYDKDPADLTPVEFAKLFPPS